MLIMKPKNMNDIAKLGIINLSEFPILVAYSEEKNINEPSRNIRKTKTSILLFLVTRQVKTARLKIIIAKLARKSLLSASFSVG